MKHLTYSIHGHPDRDHIIAKKSYFLSSRSGCKDEKRRYDGTFYFSGIIDLLIQSKLSRNILISNIGKISPTKFSPMLSSHQLWKESGESRIYDIPKGDFIWGPHLSLSQPLKIWNICTIKPYDIDEMRYLIVVLYL